MTAFEIRMAHFYDIIMESEPKNEQNDWSTSSELSLLVRHYINTSYSHGHQLSYRSFFSDLTQKISHMLTGSSYSDWEKLKLTLIQNDLHVVKRDRSKEEVMQLKARLTRFV